MLLLLVLSGCAQERVLDATKGKKTCEVHKVSLSEGLVPINYGMPIRPSAEEWDASESKFPNANLKYQGGCTIEDTKWAKVSYCPECRKAEKAWKASHAAKSAD
jgi:hypothetical protein